MRVVPLGDNVIVKPAEADEKTAGGILLPGTVRQRPEQGRVLAIGDGRLLADGSRAAHQVREGDRVVFDPFGGAEVVIDGEKLLIMAESNILAILP